MTKIIAVANPKSRVGKTSASLILGLNLARKNKKVLLVDMDPQRNLTMAAEIKEPDQLNYSIANVLLDIMNCEDIDYEQLIKSLTDGVDFIPANIQLTGVEATMNNSPSGDLVLRELLNNIKDRYDYIIIDCPSSVTTLTRNALVSADMVLIPARPSHLPKMELELMFNLIRSARRQVNPRLQIKGIILTMVDEDSSYAKEIINQLENDYGDTIQIFKNRIPSLKESANLIKDSYQLLTEEIFEL